MLMWPYDSQVLMFLDLWLGVVAFADNLPGRNRARVFFLERYSRET
jgi:hypothetical protein